MQCGHEITGQRLGDGGAGGEECPHAAHLCSELGMDARIVVLAYFLLGEPTAFFAFLADELEPLHAMEGHVNREVIEVFLQRHSVIRVIGLGDDVQHLLGGDGPCLIPDEPGDVLRPVTHPRIFEVEPTQFVVRTDSRIA